MSTERELRKGIIEESSKFLVSDPRLRFKRVDKTTMLTVIGTKEVFVSQEVYDYMRQNREELTKLIEQQCIKDCRLILTAVPFEIDFRMEHKPTEINCFVIFKNVTLVG